MKFISKILLMSQLISIFWFQNSFADLAPIVDTSPSVTIEWAWTGAVYNPDYVFRSYSDEANLDTLLRPDIEIQSWLTFEEENSVYECKSETCKLNLNVEKYFNDDILKKEHFCRWKFGSGSFTTTKTDEKCNPWYVSFEDMYGEHEIKLEIYNASSAKLVWKNSLIFNNNFWVSKILDTWTWGINTQSWTADIWNWSWTLIPFSGIVFEVQSGFYKEKFEHNSLKSLNSF